jgi:hypothetical protein
VTGRVAYVTSELGLDDEVDLVCPALGWEPVLWTDPAADWSAYSLVVCRSPWDYTWRREEFVHWARRVADVTRLLNPAEVLIRNTDKTYLRELSVPIVPTLWDVPTELPWAEVVVKPAVSAGARDTIRTWSLAEAQAHAASIVAGGKTVMIQPYLAATESEGETSVVWLGDEPSHAVRKPPMLVPDAAGADPRYDIRPRELSDELVDFSDRVLADIPERVQLMELELTEPYLVLRESEGALDRLAAAAGRLMAQPAS